MSVSTFLSDSLAASNTVRKIGAVAIGSFLVFALLYTVEALYTLWILRQFPPAGSGPRWLAWFKSSFRSVFGSCIVVDNAYTKVITFSIVHHIFLNDVY
jgi:hypothetical protein